MGDAAAWFYAREFGGVGARVALDGREAKHAAGARRLNMDDEIVLFDGRGTVARSRLVEVGSKQVVVEVLGRERREQARPRLWLASALPKGDRQSVMLSMAAQIGIARFTPLRCARGVVKATPSFRSRAERIFVEACKQSRQPHVPEIDEPMNMADIIAEASAMNWKVVIAHPEGAPPPSVDLGVKDVAVMVGPEGGFTDDEVADAVSRGTLAVSLGTSILRVETAAAVMLGYFRMRAIG